MKFSLYIDIYKTPPLLFDADLTHTSTNMGRYNCRLRLLVFSVYERTSEDDSPLSLFSIYIT